MDVLLRAARRALPVAAVVWAVAIVAAPWVAGLSGEPPRLAAAATYMVGAMVCHQRPERSFHLGLIQWPVCARCSGLYLSAAFGVLIAWAPARRLRARPFAAWRAVLIVAAAPTAATIGLEWWAGWSSGIARALAAAPLGAVIGALLAASSSFRGRLERCEPTR